MLAVKSHPLLLVWLSVLYLASEYRSGYVLECCDILLLILVGIYRIFAGCLADSNPTAHWNAITVPHMPMWSRYHVLSISVRFYCLLVTLHYQLCATTPLFYVNLKQHDRLQPDRREWWRLTQYFHYACLVYEPFIQPLFRYAVLEWFYGW